MSKGIRVDINVILQDPETQGRGRRWEILQDVVWFTSRSLRLLE